MTRVADILEHMQRIGTWVDWTTTVDGVVVGSPDAEVERAAVMWIPGCDALRRAVDLGCTLVVTHEPTFYTHRGDVENMGRWPGADEKRRFIEERGLTILRNHDVWDRMPRVGIPWSWAEFLGLDGPPCAERPRLNVYEIPETTLDDLAARVAVRTAVIGEPSVQVVGDPNAKCSRVGVGTGCACSPVSYREMGADCGIVCDDGTCYYDAIQWAVDNGFGIIRVNHGTSEEPGVAAMALYFAAEFPDVSFHHIVQGCRFRTVSSRISAT